MPLSVLLAGTSPPPAPSVFHGQRGDGEGEGGGGVLSGRTPMHARTHGAGMRALACVPLYSTRRVREAKEAPAVVWQLPVSVQLLFRWLVAVNKVHAIAMPCSEDESVNHDAADHLFDTLDEDRQAPLPGLLRASTASRRLSIDLQPRLSAPR